MSTTTSDQRSDPTFLGLPLELRRRIYNHVDNEEHVLSDPRRRTTVRLINGPSTPLLRVNQQVQDECLEVTAPDALLYIDLGPPIVDDVQPVTFETTIFLPYLKQITNIVIAAFWTHAACLPRARGRPWLDGHWPIDSFRYLESLECEWTPTKAFRSFITDIFADLRVLCDPDAAVRLSMNMTEYPDVDDPLVNAQCMVYHHPTMARLLEGTVLWPKSGNVSIEYHMRTAKQARLVPGRGFNWEWKGEVMWDLFPTSEGQSYSGFWPVFSCVMDEGDDGNGEVGERVEILDEEI